MSAEECLVCQAPLEYLERQEEMECYYCHEKFWSNSRCVNGHYVCDGCHEKIGLRVIRQYCLKTESKNPVAIMQDLIQSPHIHMHGPEHHVLVGSALLAAYRNAGGKIDLPQALEEMERRGGQVPGGVCGLWGACGAGISAGIFISLATGATPLSGESWGQSNRTTARCLEAIGKIGGPRCCKRDSYTAILQAVDCAAELGLARMEKPQKICCDMSARNNHCIGTRCPYHPPAPTETSAPAGK